MNFNSLKTALSKIEMPHDMKSRIIERCRNAKDDEDEIRLQYSIKGRNIKKLYRAAFSTCAAVAAVAAVAFVVVKTYPDSNSIIIDSSSFAETSAVSAPSESSDSFVSSQNISAASAQEMLSSLQNSNTVSLPSEIILQSSQLSAISQADTGNARTVTTVHPGEKLTVLNNILKPGNTPVVSSFSPGSISSMSSASKPDYSAPDASMSYTPSSALSQPSSSASSDGYIWGSVSSEDDTSDPIVEAPPPASDAPTHSAPAADMPSVAVRPEWVPEDKFLTKITTYEQFEGVMTQDYYYEPIHSSGAYYPEYGQSLSIHEYLELATDFYVYRTYYKLPYYLDDVNITGKYVQCDYDFFGDTIYFNYSLDPKFNELVYYNEDGEKITYSKQHGDTVTDYTIYKSGSAKSSHRYSIYFECDSIAFNIIVFLKGDVDENTCIKLLDYLPIQKVTF